MPIPKFTTLTCGAVPVVHENIDTDQIIPARFLTAVERKGFGANLFRDWRYDKQDQPVESFPLNDSRYSGQILVAGKTLVAVRAVSTQHGQLTAQDSVPLYRVSLPIFSVTMRSTMVFCLLW